MNNGYFTTGQIIRIAHKYFQYVRNSDGRYTMTYPGLVRFLAINGLLNHDKCIEFIKDMPKDEWEERTTT